MEETNVPLRKALENGKGGIHWYGKASARKGRKMAHCTFVGPTLAAVQRDAESIGVATVCDIFSSMMLSGRC
jgi:phosphoribosylaminoimidazole carboxylase (NCAIR synthetase)